MNQDFSEKKQYLFEKKNSCTGFHLNKKIRAQVVSKKKTFVQPEFPSLPPPLLVF